MNDFVHRQGWRALNVWNLENPSNLLNPLNLWNLSNPWKHDEQPDRTGQQRVVLEPQQQVEKSVEHQERRRNGAARPPAIQHRSRIPRDQQRRDPR